MANRTTIDLLMLAPELRLAAHHPGSAGQRLPISRLVEIADVLEGIANRDEADNRNDHVRALRALARAKL